MVWCVSSSIDLLKKFRKILLNPPSLEPGSWCGAGKLLIDHETCGFWLANRPRMGPIKRGYCFEIYRSNNGEGYSLVFSIIKRNSAKLCGSVVHIIEDMQLLRDPSTRRYMLYPSVDVANGNIDSREGRIYESR